MRGDTTNRSLNVTLPRLPFDNSPLTPRKRNNCAYINNHKAYLKTKGLSVEGVYSLKRNKNGEKLKRDESQYDYNLTLVNPIGSNIELPAISRERTKWRRKRGLTQQKEPVDMWRPLESRRFRDNRRLSVIDLDRERLIPGYVKPVNRSVDNKTLGKVLSRARLLELLEEESDFQPDLLMDYLLRPRTDIHSSPSTIS